MVKNSMMNVVFVVVPVFHKENVTALVMNMIALWNVMVN